MSIAKIFRSLVVPAVLAASLLPGAQAQQGVSLASGFTDFTRWTLLGSARAENSTPGNGFTYSDLILTTQGIEGQAGAGFAPTALTLDFNQAFSFDFHFFIPVVQTLRGDGLTFTLTTSPAVGNGGSGLGYENTAPFTHSVAFAIDTLNFDGQPASPSLQILQGGSVTPLAATETGLGNAIRDPDLQWYATLRYVPSGLDNSGVLTGTIDHPLGTFAVSAAVDFGAVGLAGNPVFYGFSASTGLATDGHVVTSAVPVPEPAGWALLLAGLALLGWRAAGAAACCRHAADAHPACARASL